MTRVHINEPFAQDALKDQKIDSNHKNPFKMFRIEPYKNVLVKVNVYNNCSCSPVVWTYNTSGKWKGWLDVFYLSICIVMLLLQIYLVQTLFVSIYMDVACRVDTIMQKEFDRQMPKYYQPPTQGEGFILYIL